MNNALKRMLTGSLLLIAGAALFMHNKHQLAIALISSGLILELIYLKTKNLINLKMLIIGGIYACLPFASYNQPHTVWLTLIFVTVFDAASYIGGKMFGSTKLAPQISPHKTIAGLVTGFAVVMLVHMLVIDPYYLARYFGNMHEVGTLTQQLARQWFPLLITTLGLVAVFPWIKKYFHSVNSSKSLLFVILFSKPIANMIFKAVNRFVFPGPMEQKSLCKISTLIAIEGMIGVCVLALIALSGDLLISHFKRQNNLKDSSHFFPGHGGFWDRFDSYLALMAASGMLLLVNRALSLL